MTIHNKDSEGNFIFSDPIAIRDQRISELNETIHDLNNKLPKMKKKHNILEKQSIKNKSILEDKIMTIVKLSKCEI